MAGIPTLTYGDGYSGYAVPGSAPMSGNRAAPNHGTFIIWLVVIGIVVPVAILGGLKVGGFSFVFKGR